MGRRSGEAQGRRLVPARAGVLPGLASVRAGLPLVGGRPGGRDPEGRGAARLYRHVGRLGGDGRAGGGGADCQLRRAGDRGLSAAVLHHAPELIIVMGCRRREAQGRRLVPVRPGVHPGLASVRTGLPLVALRPRCGDPEGRRTARRSYHVCRLGRDLRSFSGKNPESCFRSYRACIHGRENQLAAHIVFDFPETVFRIHVHEVGIVSFGNDIHPILIRRDLIHHISFPVYIPNHIRTGISFYRSSAFRHIQSVRNIKTAGYTEIKLTIDQPDTIQRTLERLYRCLQDVAGGILIEIGFLVRKVVVIGIEPVLTVHLFIPQEIDCMTVAVFKDNDLHQAGVIVSVTAHFFQDLLPIISDIFPAFQVIGSAGNDRPGGILPLPLLIIANRSFYYCRRVKAVQRCICISSDLRDIQQAKIIQCAGHGHAEAMARRMVIRVVLEGIRLVAQIVGIRPMGIQGLVFADGSGIGDLRSPGGGSEPTCKRIAAAGRRRQLPRGGVRPLGIEGGVGVDRVACTGGIGGPAAVFGGIPAPERAAHVLAGGRHASPGSVILQGIGFRGLDAAQGQGHIFCFRLG